MADDLKLHGEIEIDTKKANEAFSELEGKVKKTFDVAPLSAFESSLGGENASASRRKKPRCLWG